MSEQQDEQSDPYEGHTPGPWVRSGRFIYRDVLGDDGFPEGVLIAMAKVAVGYRGRGVRAHEPTTARANARLIADAPSLLRQTREQAAEIAALRERAERAERERDAAEQAPAGWVSGNGVLHLFAAVEDMKVWMDAHPGEWGAAGVLHNTEWHPRSRPAPEPTP